MGTSLLVFEESSQLSQASRRKSNNVPDFRFAKMVEMKGKYVRSAAENYDKFLDALGVGIILKKAATATTPEMTVEESDGEWTIKTSTMLKSMELKFKIGEKFDEKTPDGREVTSLVELDGNKLITTQTGEKSTKSTREFFDDKCVYTIEITDTDIVCTQTF